MVALILSTTALSRLAIFFIPPSIIALWAITHVHHVATAVVALGGVALGVLVGQHRANGHHNSLGDNVLGGDQLQTVSFAGQLQSIVYDRQFDTSPETISECD